MTGSGSNATHVLDFIAKAKAIEPAYSPRRTRVFAQAQNWSATSNPYKQVVDANARGEKVALSFKPAASVAAAATGGEDAHATNIANGIKAAGIRDGVIGLYHEPEDNVQAGEFTAAQWCAMQNRVLPILKGILGPLGWRTAICLMGWTADASSGRNVNDYRAAADVMAWDPYNYSGGGGGSDKPWATKDPSLMSPASLFGACLDVSKTWGMTPMVWEWGCLRRQADTTGAERTRWLEAVAAWPRLGEFEDMCYFEMSTTDGFSNTAIRDEPASLRAVIGIQDPCAVVKAEFATATTEIARLTTALVAAWETISDRELRLRDIVARGTLLS